jgi:lysophospholipase L1-like esterase
MDRLRWVPVLLLGVPALASAQADENEVYVITRPERTTEAVEAAYAEIPPVRYAPPADRWRYLPRIAALLAKPGAELRVVMLGDSIVNDTSRSRWDDVLQKSYPKTKITKITCVRGGAGCWWFKEPARIKKYVLDQKPDLLILGGISHNGDVDSIRDVIDAVRKASPCDVLVMGPVFGYLDPRDDKQWNEVTHPSVADFRSRLRQMAAERKVGYVDMTAAWGDYIRASGKPTDWFKRDAVHANVRGEQIVGHILASHLGPP